MLYAKVLLLFALLGVTCSASSITGTGDSLGTTVNGLLTTTDVQLGSALAGMLVTADFTGTGATDTCRFNATGTCTGTGSRFSVTLSALTDTRTLIWTITNNTTGGGANNHIQTVTFDGIGVTGTTKAMFTPCGPVNNQGATCNTIATATGGTASSTANTVVYSNAVKTNAQTVPSLVAAGFQWDAFTLVTITFSTATGNDFTSGDTFTFQNLDTDGFTATPEPGSLGLLGAGLAALGFFARRRRN